ncbi:ABC transporter permease subunit [Anaplasmataceae bacterium AB001_6]|nr:ABC transporter permease subunit [Anaplasmataceae bacterium AB001_6]
MEDFKKQIKYNVNLLFFFVIIAMTALLVKFSGIIWITLPIALFITFLFCVLKNVVIINAMRLSVIVCSMITILIIISISYETIIFFTHVSPIEFFFNTDWKLYPFIKNNTIIDNCFGVIPLIVGTVMIASIAIAISVPISIITSIYMTMYMSDRIRSYAQIMINVMAGIPTVVYGYFAINYMMNPVIYFFSNLGFSIAIDNALLSGLTMAIMLMPTTISLINNVILHAPNGIFYASLALGATKFESFIKVVFPSCMNGILSAILTSVSRALGETMIVLMLASIVPHLGWNPLNSFTTVTIHIATILTGDQGFMAIETYSAYALSFYLFILTWAINAFAVINMNKNKKKNSFYH